MVKRNQPYGRLAKILLEKQNFPGSSLRTYDDTGWTMGLMSHAKVQESADKADSRCSGAAASTSSTSPAA